MFANIVQRMVIIIWLNLLRYIFFVFSHEDILISKAQRTVSKLWCVFFQLSINVMGWQNRLKFIGETNQLKISVLNAYFYYFGQFHVFL